MSDEPERFTPEQTDNVERDGEGNPLRPMTPRLMTQLFGVPALIVLIVVSSAVVVTLAFGWIGLGQRQDINGLIDKLAMGSGQRIAGMLLPRDKELWQAALEIANRLRNIDSEIPVEERPAVAERLATVLKRTVDESAKSEQNGARERSMFMARALGRIREPVALDYFLEMLASEHVFARTAGVAGVAEMSGVDGVAERAAALIPSLQDHRSAELRMIAAAALGRIASPDDEKVVAALRRQLTDDDEVRWNVALALVRLGHEEPARGDVLDMLNPAYWQGRKIKYDVGSDRTRDITPREIQRNMLAALAALGRVRDADIRAAIEKLSQGADPTVANSARATLARIDGEH